MARNGHGFGVNIQLGMMAEMVEEDALGVAFMSSGLFSLCRKSSLLLREYRQTKE